MSSVVYLFLWNVWFITRCTQTKWCYQYLYRFLITVAALTVTTYLDLSAISQWTIHICWSIIWILERRISLEFFPTLYASYGPEAFGLRWLREEFREKLEINFLKILKEMQKLKKTNKRFTILFWIYNDIFFVSGQQFIEQEINIKWYKL